MSPPLPSPSVFASTPPAPQDDRAISSAQSRWLFAFSVAAIGFVSAILGSKLYSWHYRWAPYITPGVSFGLVSSLWWLLREKWFRKREAAIVLIGATVAYAAAFWAALFAFAFLSKGQTAPTVLRLAEAGIIGGAAGTILLGGALALTSKNFLRRLERVPCHRHGCGAAALGSFGKEDQIPTLGNFGRDFSSFFGSSRSQHTCGALFTRAKLRAGWQMSEVWRSDAGPHG
jgi:hypothetical protein